MSEGTYHRWRHQFGEMGIDEVRRLKDLEENTRLKRIVAELEIDALKEIVRGNF